MRDLKVDELQQVYGAGSYRPSKGGSSCHGSTHKKSTHKKSSSHKKSSKKCKSTGKHKHS